MKLRYLSAFLPEYKVIDGLVVFKSDSSYRWRNSVMTEEEFSITSHRHRNRIFPTLILASSDFIVSALYFKEKI